MRVFVLGHKGMLGHVVARYLSEQNCDVVTSEARYEALPRDPLIEAVRNSNCEWIVNAAAKIKHKSQNPIELLTANSLLPLQLKARMLPGQRLIHASSEGVFSGTRGDYKVDDEPDADNTYGFSKILGEAIAAPGKCTVVRVSIIGTEQNGGPGLMEWFLRQEGEAQGFVNHLWNGITTLEWAKVCFEIMSGKVTAQQQPIVQPGVWPSVSKYELLKLIGEIWDHPVKVTPIEAAQSIDSTLIPNLPRPPLKAQLAELKQWYTERYHRN